MQTLDSLIWLTVSSKTESVAATIVVLKIAVSRDGLLSDAGRAGHSTSKTRFRRWRYQIPIFGIF